MKVDGDSRLGCHGDRARGGGAGVGGQRGVRARGVAAMVVALQGMRGVDITRGCAPRRAAVWQLVRNKKKKKEKKYL